MPLLEFYLIIINNHCECLKIAVFKALHAAISAKEEAQSKRLVEAIELNKSFVSHMVESFNSCESVYALKWNLIALLAVNFASKKVQNFIFFETSFFRILKDCLNGPLRELELHFYIVENIKSLCFSEQFLDKVSQTFSEVLLRNLFTNFSRFMSEGFSKIVLCYVQIFLLLKNTSQMRSFLSDPQIFPQLMHFFLNPECTFEIKVIFLKLMIFCVNKDVKFAQSFDVKYTLYHSGFFCPVNEQSETLLRLVANQESKESQLDQSRDKEKENARGQKASGNKDWQVKKSFKLGWLLTNCFEMAHAKNCSLVVERCLVLFGYCLEFKSISGFLKKKINVLDGLTEDFPEKIKFLQSKIKI